jgi:phosphate transport system permease protein
MRRRNAQRLVWALLGVLTLLLLVPVLGLLTALVIQGWPALSWNLFSAPKGGGGGVAAALAGTVWLTAGSLAITMPIGVAAAIYLGEYAPDNWLTRTINVAIANLAGVPAIVHALFGVAAFVQFMDLSPTLAASCTLGVMTLPIVILSTREALQAVPQEFREACWTMGASRWQAIRHVVLPNCWSGILTGLILVVCRVVGVTAPVMLTGVAALSMHLFDVTYGAPEVTEVDPAAIALVLILAVLAMNAIAIGFRMRLRRRTAW